MSTFENPISVAATAREYLATRQKLQAKHFATNTNKTDLIIGLRLKPEFHSLHKHIRFRELDDVDCIWLAKAVLGSVARAFPLNRGVAIAVLLGALGYGQTLPTLRRQAGQTLSEPEGRKFRV
jgi:hypothetical protein